MFIPIDHPDTTTTATTTTTQVDACLARLQSDFSDLEDSPVIKITKDNLANGEPDLKNFIIAVTPGDDSPWYGAKYRFKVNCPPDFPMATFNVEIMDACYHPNMDLVKDNKPARICLSLLRTQWKPIYTVKHLTYSLIGMFSNPNHADPLNRSAATWMANDHQEFLNLVSKTLKGGKHDFEDNEGILQSTQFPKFN